MPTCSLRLSAVGCLVVMLLLAGCSGDDESSVSSTTTRPPRSTTTAGAATDLSATTDPPPTTDPTTATTVAPPRPPAPTGVIDGSIRTSDGRDRTYRLFVPQSLPGDRSVPLLVAMHGGTGWGGIYAAISGYDEIAREDGFIVVYPDGFGIGEDGAAFRTWNAGDCCGPARNQNVDDLGFIHQLVDHIDRSYPIDGQRIFGIGHSNGGMLAYRLACENPGRFAAFAQQAGALGVDRCAPDRPVSFLHLHGTADSHVPIDGGVGPDSLAGVDFRSVADSVAMLSAAIGCGGPTSGSHANPDVSIETLSCSRDTEVLLMLVEGAGHSWMGRPAPRGGESYPDLDASRVLWEFVSSHPRR